MNTTHKQSTADGQMGRDVSEKVSCTEMPVVLLKGGDVVLTHAGCAATVKDLYRGIGTGQNTLLAFLSFSGKYLTVHGYWIAQISTLKSSSSPADCVLIFHAFPNKLTSFKS